MWFAMVSLKANFVKESPYSGTAWSHTVVVPSPCVLLLFSSVSLFIFFFSFVCLLSWTKFKKKKILNAYFCKSYVLLTQSSYASPGLGTELWAGNQTLYVWGFICILTLEVTPTGGTRTGTVQIAVFWYSYQLLGYSLFRLDLSAIIFLSVLFVFF